MFLPPAVAILAQVQTAPKQTVVRGAFWPIASTPEGPLSSHPKLMTASSAVISAQNGADRPIADGRSLRLNAWMPTLGE